MLNDVDNNTLECLTEKAINGNKEALTALIQHPKFIQLLDNISAWAARKYNQDKEDVRENVWIRIYNNIETLRQSSRFEEWCYQVTKHYCLNEIRHQQVERDFQDKVRNQNREDKRRGGKPLVQPKLVPTQEQELLIKEQELVLKEVVRKATEKFPKWLVDAWSIGKTPKQIIEETGQPPSTVYRMLKKLEKAIIDESLSEIETMRSQMQSSQTEIESEKKITRNILERLRID